MTSVYLAGFDVFAPDAVARGAALKRMCAEQGVIGLYPLDNEADSAQKIFEGNCALIDRAEAVIANVNFFRGDEPDSGTAFEIGYAQAKGKKIYLYLQDTRTLREKLGAQDENGYAVENFSLPVNLMLACAADGIDESFVQALRRFAADRA